MPVCKKCSQDKPAAEMAKYAGEITETCKACRFQRGNGGGATPRKKGQPR
jgi:hypothetical protein